MVYYPYLIWAFYKEWRAESELCGTPWNPILATPIMQTFLSGLNMHWSLQLFSKRPRKGRASANDGSCSTGSPAPAKYSKHL
jgi:hypothetical protein